MLASGTRALWWFLKWLHPQSSKSQTLPIGSGYPPTSTCLLLPIAGPSLGWGLGHFDPCCCCCLASGLPASSQNDRI